MSVPDIIDTAAPLFCSGVENLDAFKETAAHRRNHCIWIMPTRGLVPIRVVRSWDQMRWFMNSGVLKLDPMQYEVGAAYDSSIHTALDAPEVADYPWVWTYEEDNVQPTDVFHKLFGAMWKCIDCGDDMPRDARGNPAKDWRCANGHKGLDGISGLYTTKSDPPMPMCYGDPAIYRETGDLEFRPREISAQIAKGEVVECNGIANGCSLFRKDLFREIPAPWFRTVDHPDSTRGFTQDLYLCRKAIEMVGARFAVHTGVIVGHYDFATGRMY